MEAVDCWSTTQKINDKDHVSMVDSVQDGRRILPAMFFENHDPDSVDNDSPKVAQLS
jgi:hypothetical protein